jgi:hypothetical protein
MNDISMILLMISLVIFMATELSVSLITGEGVMMFRGRAIDYEQP